MKPFEVALSAHNRNDLKTAGELYRQILQEQPDHFAATHMLGVLYLQTGDAPHAETLLRKAAQMNPALPEVHNNLGLALKQQGRLEEAIALYDRALSLRPVYAAAMGNKANALLRLGCAKEAINWFDRAIAQAPENADYFYNRATALEALGEFESAASDYRAALAMKPDFSDALNNLGNSLKALGQYEAALEVYDRALTLKPDRADAHSNRGAVLFLLRRFDAALEALDRAIMLDPSLTEAYCNRGNVRRETGRIDEALADYFCALAIRPDDEQAVWNLAVTRLLLGRWREGWESYEIRFAKRINPSRRPSLRSAEWSGEDLKGRRILLYTEQGLGDAIQFSRFADILAADGAQPTLLVPGRLQKLLATLGLDVKSELSEDSSFDFSAPLMSLPRLLRLTPSSVPPTGAYLHAEPDRIAAWRVRLAGEGFKVGLCWQGNPTGTVDSGRSIPLTEFATLSAVPGVRLISLQCGPGAEQTVNLPSGMAVEVYDDLDGGPDGFLDTAAIIANLDLVISCDTSVAHLAGALGKPVWLALKYVPDWRWLLEREDTPWYSSMKLYRQAQLDQWAPVFERMTVDLRHLCAR